MVKQFEYIVVGSGATGAMAARTLVEAGKDTLVLDPGIWNEERRKLIPDLDWETIRRKDRTQHRYFLGDDFEGIVWEESRVGSQLTPPRVYLKEKVEEWMKFQSQSFFPFESMAKGGLGGGWGAGCFVFSEAELKQCGLKAESMAKAYQQVSDWIGISGSKDDGAPFSVGNLQNLQQPFQLDASMRSIFARYEQKKKDLNKEGFWLGRSGMALLTQYHEGRKASQGYEMEFWADNDKSTYRSWMTIDQLKSRSNFTYEDGWMVTHFKEEDGAVLVYARSLETKEEVEFRCKKLILAAGVLSTARIVLRSQGAYNIKLPVLCNSYTYMPTLQWSNLGKGFNKNRSGLCQAMLFYDKECRNETVSQAALFGYRQLLLFKLAKEAPLGFSYSKEIMRLLESSFVIAGIHHPEKAGGNKWIELIPSESQIVGDFMQGEYEHNKMEKKEILQTELAYRKALIRLGCIPIKSIRTPQGGSIHYAGTLPFTNKEEPFTIHAKGNLSGHKNVYIGDGSGFKYLPAKGLTLSLMANAYNVAREAINQE